jgi:hypothetical protein
MPETDVPVTNPPVEFSRHDNFESLYANNIQFEASEWDLKILFGELDLRGGKVAVEQHTAMNIPWVQAKLLLFYLGVQVAINEKINGPIRIPKTVLPPEPPPLPEQFKDNPLALELRAFADKMRKDFIASLNASGEIAIPHKP